MHNRRNSCVT